MAIRKRYLPEQEIQTGIGPVKVRQPRVNDKRVDEHDQRIRFSSEILPKYLRKTRSIEELIPWLCLEGITTGDFSEALAALLGPEAPGLSASTVVRHKEVWQKEYEAWSKRAIIGAARPEGGRACAPPPAAATDASEALDHPDDASIGHLERQRFLGGLLPRYSRDAA